MDLTEILLEFDEVIEILHNETYHDTANTFRLVVEEVKAELATLRADKERLDWIRKFKPEICHYGDKALYPVVIHWQQDGIPHWNTGCITNTVKAKTFNAAIAKAKRSDGDADKAVEPQLGTTAEDG